MNALAQVPAWFWITLGTIVALAGLVAVVWGWKHRYHPEHRLSVPAIVAGAARTLAESEEHRVRYGSMILAEERALDWAARNELLPPELAHEPTAAEVIASRAAHGYIPELDPDAEAWGGRGPSASYAEWLAEGDPDDLGPGAGVTPFAGYNSHLPGGFVPAKVDSPAPDDFYEEDEPVEDMRAWDSGERVLVIPITPKRGPTLADLGTRCDVFMAIMRADHERWMAGARERWAAA